MKGYVNISGINQTGTLDRLHVIRRAIILRALLKKQQGIVDAGGKIYIDEDVLKAMLIIHEYKHGNRSLGAVIEMSKLSGRTKFDKSVLPPKRQLDLHVDGDIFIKLVDKDLFYATVIERLARYIHEEYVINQKKKKEPKPASHPSMQPWEKLEPDLKESNRQQAFDYLVKLLRVGCFYREITEQDGQVEQFEFTGDEIELLAEREHIRWNSVMIQQGWEYGRSRDEKNKKHESLLPWRDLTEKVKDYDRDAIKAIPKIFEMLGYEVYRLKAK